MGDRITIHLGTYKSYDKALRNLSLEKHISMSKLFDQALLLLFEKFNVKVHIKSKNYLDEVRFFCKFCGMELKDNFMIIAAENEYFITRLYVCCKGECDMILQKRLHSNEIDFSSDFDKGFDFIDYLFENKKFSSDYLKNIAIEIKKILSNSYYTKLLEEGKNE